MNGLSTKVRKRERSLNLVILWLANTWTCFVLPSKSMNGRSLHPPTFLAFMMTQSRGSPGQRRRHGFESEAEAEMGPRRWLGDSWEA